MSFIKDKITFDYECEKIAELSLSREVLESISYSRLQEILIDWLDTRCEELSVQDFANVPAGYILATERYFCTFSHTPDGGGIYLLTEKKHVLKNSFILEYD